MDQPDTEELRCFIGAFVAAESTASLAAALRLPAAVRRVERENWHVTFRFLGSVQATGVPDLLAVVMALTGHPHDVAVTGFIGLPRATYARVVAAEIAADATLATWAEQLARRFGPPDRPFRPHVTVARIRRQIGFRRQALSEPLPIRLEAPALYRSRRDRDGSRYERVVLPRQHGS